MALARPSFIPDFDRIPEFPENGTSGKGWLDWVDELLDNIFGGIPTFDDIRDFLTDTSWEDFVPDGTRNFLYLIDAKNRLKDL